MLRQLSKRLRHSVRDRLLLGGVAVLAPISVAFGAWGVDTQREVLLETIARQGRSLTGAAAIFCVEPLLAKDRPVLDGYVEELTSEKAAVVYARIEDARGKVLVEAQAPDAETTRTTEHSALVRVPDAPGNPICGRVVLGLSTEPAEAALADSRRLQLIETCAGFLALVLGLAWLHYRLVGRPVQILDRDAQRLARADLSQPITLQSEDEFGRLAQALEEMRKGLAASYDEIRQQNEGLKELDRLKSEFLATMSHEIRTPMSGVIGFARELLATELDPEQREMVGLVVRSADSLLKILSDILDFSKIEAGKIELERIVFDLEQVIGDSVALAGPAAREKDVSLALNVDQKPPLLVGDPLRVRQVVGNLVSNAIKFSRGGSVRVCVDVLAADDESARVGIAVRDTGIGVPPDKLELLFEPFRQVDGSHSRQFGGSGLGLSICQGLLAMMDSRIEVVSEVGRGSSFSFELLLPVAPPGAEVAVVSEAAVARRPAAMAAGAAEIAAEVQAPIADVPSGDFTILHADLTDAEPEPESPGDQAVAAGIRVLLADDNETNRKLLKMMLARLGAEVVVADDGKAAVDVFFGAPSFDLVLMDCQMPEMDGFEATEKIRARQSKGRTPILALTANTVAGLRDRCLAAGMDGYLTKPLLLKDLRTALSRWARPLRGPSGDA